MNVKPIVAATDGSEEFAGSRVGRPARPSCTPRRRRIVSAAPPPPRMIRASNSAGSLSTSLDLHPLPNATWPCTLRRPGAARVAPGLGDLDCTGGRAACARRSPRADPARRRWWLTGRRGPPRALPPRRSRRGPVGQLDAVFAPPPARAGSSLMLPRSPSRAPMAAGRHPGEPDRALRRRHRAPFEDLPAARGQGSGPRHVDAGPTNRRLPAAGRRRTERSEAGPGKHPDGPGSAFRQRLDQPGPIRPWVCAPSTSNG